MNKEFAMEPLVATVEETKNAIKHGHTKTAELIKNGTLKSKLFGRKRLVYWSSIKEYLGINDEPA